MRGRKIEAAVVSLGYSWQTRLIVDQLGRQAQLMPFDCGILSRADIICALESNGDSLLHRDERKSSVTVARGVVDETEGSERPPSHGSASDGRSEVWKEFSRLLRCGVPKVLMLSNAHGDLKDASKDKADFDRNFGLDRIAFEEISRALDAFGTRNYRLMFLSRSLDELERTAADDRLDHRFVGNLSPQSSHVKVAARLSPFLNEPSLEGACGAYDQRDKLVTAISRDVAIIYKTEGSVRRPVGSIARMDGGFAAFFEGRDQHVTAVSAERSLYFRMARGGRRIIPLLSELLTAARLDTLQMNNVRTAHS